MGQGRIKERGRSVVAEGESPGSTTVCPRYIVIMAARDEEKYIGGALESMVSQMCAPTKVVVVDDGSTDTTGEIVKRYSREHAWIKLVTRPNRGYRHPGPGVVSAFYEGLESVKDVHYEYLAKLDADCEYPEDYFAKLFAEFEKNPKLGICGGVAWIKNEKELTRDKRPRHHVRGATKIYRRACFEEIGGIDRVLGWDVLDGFTARFKGWEAYTVESAHFLMNRSAGGPIGLRKMWIGNGKIAYMQHHSLLHLLTRAIRRSVDRPYILGGLLLLVGYFVGWWESLPRIDDPNLIRFVQREQRRYLWKVLTLQATD